MAGKWTGGIVTSSRSEEPPDVDKWVPVAVPGRPASFSAVDDPIAYRTTFSDPRRNPTERTRLELRGAYGRTRVWINGTFLGEHDSYFIPAQFEFEPQQTNELVVCCEPPAQDGVAGIYETDDVPPAVGKPGIWWGVDVQVRPTTFISSFSVTPQVTDDGAVIDTTVEVDAGQAVDDSIMLSLRPEGFRGGGAMERARIDAEAGERVTVSRSIEVRDPKRWWPRGHGPQHRYTVRAKLGADSVERTVGLRTVERDDDGLFVNGQRVRAYGIERLPSASDTDHEDVRRAINTNATLVRVRGHVPSPAFYAACDEAGLLVWQDLPIRGDSDQFDADHATSLLESLETTCGSHPSLALYGVQSDPVEPPVGPFGSGLFDKLSFRWRAWRTGFDRTLAASVADVAPAGKSAIAVSGPPGVSPDATDLFPGWDYLEAGDIEWLLERYDPSVVGRFGAGSVARIDGGPIPGLEPTVLEERISDAKESQRAQAATVKTVAEALRRHQCGIVVASALRDATVDGGMGILTSDGSTKPASDALSSAYEPVQTVLDDPPASGSVGMTLLNDTDERIEATIRWDAGEETGETTAVAEPYETTPAGTIDIPTDATGVTLETRVGERAIRNESHL